MTIQDYFNKKFQQQVDQAISEICLRMRNQDISKEISSMIEDLK